MSYSSVSSVEVRVGIKPDDLGLADKPALDAFIQELLGQVSDLMNKLMHRDWTIEPGGVPAGVDGIAADVTANALREMMVTRQSPVTRIDDFTVQIATGQILSPDILRRVRLYSAQVMSVDLGHGDLRPADMWWPFREEDL